MSHALIWQAAIVLRFNEHGEVSSHYNCVSIKFWNQAKPKMLLAWILLLESLYVFRCDVTYLSSPHSTRYQYRYNSIWRAMQRYEKEVFEMTIVLRYLSKNDFYCLQNVSVCDGFRILFCSLFNKNSSPPSFAQLKHLCDFDYNCFQIKINCMLARSPIESCLIEKQKWHMHLCCS